MLETFINESKKELVGGGFDTVREKLGQYRNAYEALDKLYDVLGNNIQAANNSMINYVSPEEELSDRYKEELKETIRKCNLEIDSLWEKINRVIHHYDYAYDSRGNVLMSNGHAVINHWTEPAFSEEERREFKERILEIRIEIEKLKKIIKKIDELEPNDSAFFSSVESLDGQLTSITSKIDSINPSYFASY